MQSSFSGNAKHTSLKLMRKKNEECFRVIYYELYLLENEALIYLQKHEERKNAKFYSTWKNFDLYYQNKTRVSKIETILRNMYRKNNNTTNIKNSNDTEVEE